MKKMGTRNNRHHRLSRSLGGSNHPSNISMVDERQHQSFHNLFQDTRPQAICDALNNTWGAPSYHFIVVEKETLRGVQKLIKQINT